MLAWIDLETTGLDADSCDVLEVACIVTDDKLEEVARFECVVRHLGAEQLAKLDLSDEEQLKDAAEDACVDPFVVKMHLTNGLWSACAESPFLLYEVDCQLAEFIQRCCPETGERRGPQLAGSTISFDRAFLKEHMPRAHALLHYRNLDTTTLNELARRFWPTVHDQRPAEVKGHRAMADIEYSIWVAKYYATRLAPVVEEQAGADSYEGDL